MNGFMRILNGLGGFFIAVVLLLSIVAILGTCAILTQRAEATHYYKIENAGEIEQINSDNAKYRTSTESSVE